MLREMSKLWLFVLAAVAAALVFSLIVSAMAVFSFGWFNNSTANFRGNVAKRQLVEANGSYRIAAYDSFFDKCSAVQADEDRIAAATQELRTSDPSAQRKTVLNATITALRGNRAELIRQYNVDADKGYTLGQFQSSKLPYHLDIEARETTCTA